MGIEDEPYMLPSTEGAENFCSLHGNLIPTVIDCVLPDFLRGNGQRDHELVLDPVTKLPWMSVSSYEQFDIVCGQAIGDKSVTKLPWMIAVRPYTSYWNAFQLKRLIASGQRPARFDDPDALLLDEDDTPIGKGKEPILAEHSPKDWCHGSCRGVNFVVKNPEVLFQKAAKYTELTDLAGELTQLSLCPILDSQKLGDTNISELGDPDIPDLVTLCHETKECLVLSMWRRGVVDNEDMHWSVGPHHAISRLLPDEHGIIYGASYDPCCPEDKSFKTHDTAENLIQEMKGLQGFNANFDEKKSIDSYAMEVLNLESQNEDLKLKSNINTELQKIKASLQNIAAMVKQRCPPNDEETIGCSSMKMPAWVSPTDDLSWELSDLEPYPDRDAVHGELEDFQMESDQSPKLPSPASSSSNSMEASPRHLSGSDQEGSASSEG